MPAPSLASIAEPVWSELQRFVRFGPEDIALLAGLRDQVRPHFEGISARFYERIAEHEGAHEHLRDDAHVARMQRQLVDWLERMFTGPYDAAYYEKTAQLGRDHVRVGWPIRYATGAMTLLRTELHRIAAQVRPEAASPLAEAIDKMLDLELATMLETHMDDQLQRIRRRKELQRAEAESHHAELEERWSDAVELARIVFVALDAEGRIELFNREAEMTTGYHRDEVVGRPFVELLVPIELQGEVRDALEAARGGARPVVEGSSIRTRAGRLREVRWQFAWRADPASGEALFAIGQDTTVQSRLAARVRQSERLAAVGTLAAGLAHEIRNPLNGAMLHLTVLERGLKKAKIEDVETAEAVAIARAEIQRLSALVTEFLDFARPQPLQREWGDLRRLCERAARSMGSQMDVTSAAEILLDLPTGPVELAFDEARIEELLRNLVTNAIEAMAPVGGPVTIRLRREPRHAVIEVEDSGPGIDDPAAPVFDPFYTTKTSGAGLGLSVVHRIAADHGGTVTFKSRPGRTVFRLELPIETPPDSRIPERGAP